MTPPTDKSIEEILKLLDTVRSEDLDFVRNPSTSRNEARRFILAGNKLHRRRRKGDPPSSNAEGIESRYVSLDWTKHTLYLLLARIDLSEFICRNFPKQGIALAEEVNRATSGQLRWLQHQRKKGDEYVFTGKGWDRRKVWRWVNKRYHRQENAVYGNRERKNLLENIKYRLAEAPETFRAYTSLLWGLTEWGRLRPYRPVPTDRVRATPPGSGTWQPSDDARAAPDLEVDWEKKSPYALLANWLEDTLRCLDSCREAEQLRDIALERLTQPTLRVTRSDKLTALADECGTAEWRQRAINTTALERQSEDLYLAALPVLLKLKDQDKKLLIALYRGLKGQQLYEHMGRAKSSISGKLPRLIGQLLSWSKDLYSGLETREEMTPGEAFDAESAQAAVDRLMTTLAGPPDVVLDQIRRWNERQGGTRADDFDEATARIGLEVYRQLLLTTPHPDHTEKTDEGGAR